MSGTEQQKSSAATKVIATASVIIALLIGYNMLSQSKVQDCRARGIAITSQGMVSIQDVRWGLSGCQFLVRWSGTTGTYWYDEFRIRTLETK